MNVISLKADSALQVAQTIPSNLPTTVEITAPAVLPAPVLSGRSLTVTAVSADIEKLAALLLTQTNEAREEAILGTLRALSDAGVFEALHARANAENTVVYAILETLATELSALEAQLPAKEQAVEDAQTAVNNLTEDATDEEIAAANEKLTTATNELNELETSIQEKEDAMLSTFMGLDTKGFQMLAEALGIDLADLHNITPLQDVTEDDVGVGNIPLTERSPVSIIRESLRNLIGDFTDNLALRREEHV